MWSAAGDDARDASYYTKRSLLAAVWTSTFLFWLDDRSEACQDTFAFLDRRIENVMQIGRVRASLDDFFRGLGRLNPMMQRR
jgi:ubiquinone biosynthesis protein COQ9